MHDRAIVREAAQQLAEGHFAAARARLGAQRVKVEHDAHSDRGVQRRRRGRRGCRCFGMRPIVATLVRALGVAVLPGVVLVRSAAVVPTHRAAWAQVAVVRFAMPALVARMSMRAVSTLVARMAVLTAMAAIFPAPAALTVARVSTVVVPRFAVAARATLAAVVFAPIAVVVPVLRCARFVAELLRFPCGGPWLVAAIVSTRTLLALAARAIVSVGCFGARFGRSIALRQRCRRFRRLVGGGFWDRRDGVPVRLVAAIAVCERPRARGALWICVAALSAATAAAATPAARGCIGWRVWFLRNDWELYSGI